MKRYDEYIGIGTLEKIKTIIDEVKPKNIFVSSGRTSLKASGAESIINPILKKYNTIYFNDFSSNPKINDINKGISIFNDKIDLVIAIGGGSAIDVGKCINILYAQNDDPINYVVGKEKIKYPGCPLVAVPTTAGSGSEATHFAVVYVNNVKYSLAHEYILPDYAIVDPKLTLSMPHKLAAASGMDAFCQAIESYWSIHSTVESQKYSEKAISLIDSNLKDSVVTGKLEYREKMALAAHLAGKAINISKTTAPHALSYILTSKYNLPHGHAVGLTLGAILEYNSEVTDYDCNDSRGKKHVNNMIDRIIKLINCNNAKIAKEYIRKYMNNIGLSTDMNELRISKDEIKELIEMVNYERLNNNPRDLSDKHKLEKILLSIYDDDII